VGTHHWDDKQQALSGEDMVLLQQAGAALLTQGQSHLSSQHFSPDICRSLLAGFHVSNHGHLSIAEES
jgi:hypothetical protein